MMNIICIVGSPHGTGGNTARLMNFVLQGARSQGAFCEVISLADKEVRPCCGCDSCHRSGDCPLDDDFAEIRRKVEAADGVILASPNYIFSVTAQMKAFMDRCSGVIHCMSFRSKYGLSVVTSGGGEDAPIVDYMNQFLLMTGIHPVGAVHAAMSTLPEGEFPEELQKQARELGAHLVQAWESGAVSEETILAMASFRERMRSLVTWQKDAWPYEYDYWQRNHDLQ